MKVLMISPYFPPIMAGAEIYTYKLALYLVRKGYDVDVITKHFGNLPGYESMEGVNVYRVRSFNVPKLRSFISMPSMFFKALKKDYDIIHAHIPYPSAIISYFVSKLKSTPYIVTSQGDELLDYPEAKELKYIKPLTGLALRNAKKVHCISNALKHSLVENFKVPEEKIHVIPNGVDVKKFKPEKKRDLKGKFNAEFILVNVSRLSPKNNIGKTIEAVKKVTEKYKKFKYLIIGDGEEKERLERMIKELGLEDKVILTGWVDNDLLPSYIAGSDALIRTSVTEGLGIVFLEAMACGTPVIASNVQGILDIVRDHETGLLVDPNNIATISEKIIEIIENDRLRKDLSIKGLEYVKEFDWEQICKKSETLYLES